MLMALSDFVMVNPIDQPAGATVGMPHIKSHHIMSDARNNSCYMFLLLVSGFDSPSTYSKKTEFGILNPQPLSHDLHMSHCIPSRCLPSILTKDWASRRVINPDAMHMTIKFIPVFRMLNTLKNVWWHFANWLFNLVGGWPTHLKNMSSSILSGLSPIYYGK